MNIYTVVSEFRFDVAQAVVGSEQLQGKVESLSNSVNNAVESIKGLGVGMVAQLTGMQAGIAGFFSSAIGASDKFLNSQLSFTQIIDANMEHLTGTIGTMNEKMAVSKKIMGEIAADARHFGLPATELLEMTKTMSAMLVPKGLAGENFKGARDISRNLLKSAPNLGINPADVQGQLLRAVEGSASMGDTLFRRLLTEAPEPFKEAKIKDAKGFNALDTAKRFGILSDAMAKFSNNTDILEMRAKTMSGVMQTVRDTFTGFTSVLKPIGDVLMPLVVQALDMLLKWIQNDGQKIINEFAKFLKKFTESPKEMLLELNQIATLSSDLNLATKLAGITVFIMHFQELVKFLSTLPVIGPIIGQFGGGLIKLLEYLKPTRKWLDAISWAFSNIGKVMSFAWPFLRMVIVGLLEFGGAVAAFLIPLQGLGRAMLRIKIETLEWFANNAADLTVLLGRAQAAFALIFTPIQDLIKGFEELFYLILGGTFFLDAGKKGLFEFVDALELFGKAVLGVWSALRGVVNGIFEMITTIITNAKVLIGNLLGGNFANADLGTENAFASFGQGFMDEFNKSFSRASTPLVDGNVDNAKVSGTINNYDVKMTNNFKEVLQPDRIAFTIKDQLEKSSVNRTKSRVSSIAGLQAGAI
jgi:hypothetical protein